jgi:hypothetical protein
MSALDEIIARIQGYTKVLAEPNAVQLKVLLQGARALKLEAENKKKAINEEIEREKAEIEKGWEALKWAQAKARSAIDRANEMTKGAEMQSKIFEATTATLKESGAAQT